MELNGDRAIRVHDCGVREGGYSSVIKSNLDIAPR